MSINSRPTTTRKADHRGGWRGGAAFLLVALLLGAVLLLVDLEEERPTFYESARVPLTEAATILSSIYAEEKALADGLREVHDRLDNAIALLDRAERLDPEDRTQIETLRVRLRELENNDEILVADPKTLKRIYQELTEQLNALASELAEPRS